MTNTYVTVDADGNPITFKASGSGTAGDPFVPQVELTQSTVSDLTGRYWHRSVDLLPPISAVDFWNINQGGISQAVSMYAPLTSPTLDNMDMVAYTLLGGGYAMTGENTPDVNIRLFLHGPQAGTQGRPFNLDPALDLSVPYDTAILVGEEMTSSAPSSTNYHHCSLLKPGYVWPHQLYVHLQTQPTSGWLAVKMDVRYVGREVA